MNHPATSKGIGLKRPQLCSTLDAMRQKLLGIRDFL